MVWVGTRITALLHATTSRLDTLITPRLSTCKVVAPSPQCRLSWKKFGTTPVLYDSMLPKTACGWTDGKAVLGVRFISTIHAPLETAPPMGLWPRALAKMSMLPNDVSSYLVLNNVGGATASRASVSYTRKIAARKVCVKKKRKRGFA
jgi:hypothetical protein